MEAFLWDPQKVKVKIPSLVNSWEADSQWPAVKVITLLGSLIFYLVGYMFSFVTTN